VARGLFAEPRIYDVLLRFSTNPGDMLADNVSSPRGLALKVLGISDEKRRRTQGKQHKTLFV